MPTFLDPGIGPRGGAVINWRGSFDPTSGYSAGDLVLYRGSLFECTAAYAGPVAVTCVGTSTASPAAATIALPAGCQAGDVAMLVQTLFTNALAAGQNGPDGKPYQVIGMLQSASEYGAEMWAYVLTAGDVTTGTLPTVANAALAYSLTVFRNSAIPTAAPRSLINAAVTSPSSPFVWTSGSYASGGGMPFLVGCTQWATSSYGASGGAGVSNVTGPKDTNGVGLFTGTGAVVAPGGTVGPLTFSNVHDGTNGSLAIFEMPQGLPLGNFTALPDSLSMNYKGTWISGNSYAPGDTVTYQGSAYVCATPVTGVAQYVGSLMGYANGVGPGLPGGAGVNDLCVVALSISSASVNPTLPTGFTSIGSPTYTSQGVRILLAQKLLTAVDIAAAFVTMTGFVCVAGAVFRNAAASAVTAFTVTLTTASLTPVKSGYVFSAAADNLTAPMGTGVIVPPSQLSGIVQATGFTNPTTVAMSLSSGVEPTVASVATTTRAFTASGASTGSNKSTASVAIYPSTAGFPYGAFDEIAQQAAPYRVVNANYTPTPADSTLDLQTANITLTLPDATVMQGQIFTIRCTMSSTAGCLVATTSSQTLEGYAFTASRIYRGEWVTFISDGVGWRVVDASAGGIQNQTAQTTFTVRAMDIICRRIFTIGSSGTTVTMAKSSNTGTQTAFYGGVTFDTTALNAATLTINAASGDTIGVDGAATSLVVKAKQTQFSLIPVTAAWRIVGDVSRIIAVSANYTVTAQDAMSDSIIAMTGAFTVTLPTAISAGAGARITIKNMGTGLVTITPFGSQTIDTLVGAFLSAQNDFITFQSDGANWLIRAQSMIGATNKMNVVAASGAAKTIPLVSLATLNWITLTANLTLTFPTAQQGQTFEVAVTQNATGSWTVTWPGTVKWPGGSAPTVTVTALKTDRFRFTCIDGTNWMAEIVGQNI